MHCGGVDAGEVPGRAAQGPEELLSYLLVGAFHCGMVGFHNV